MAGIAIPAEGPSMARRTLGSLVPHPASIGKVTGARSGIATPHMKFARGGVDRAENIGENLFQPINPEGGIPDVGVNFITSPQLAVGNGPPKAQGAQARQQQDGISQFNQASSGINNLMGDYSAASSLLGKGSGIGSALPGMNMANPLENAGLVASTNTDAGAGQMLSILGASDSAGAASAAASNPGFWSSIMAMLPDFAAAAAKGGAIHKPEHRAFGGELLPDIISGIGDIVGAFYGDPMAGSQATGLLNKLDNGKTNAGLQLSNMNKGGTPNRDGGGEVNGLINSLMRQESHETYHPSGFLNSAGPGRTDTINTNVPAGAYVIPADVVSGLGEGNSLAGSAVIDRMFSTSPHGINAPKIRRGNGAPRPPSSSYANNSLEPQGVDTNFINGVGKGEYAKGGKAEEKAPVVVAGGEHVLSPQQIIAKFGSLKRGHRILDHWVVAERERIAKEMLKLAPPVGSRVKKK